MTRPNASLLPAVMLLAIAATTGPGEQETKPENRRASAKTLKRRRQRRRQRRRAKP